MFEPRKDKEWTLIHLKKETRERLHKMMSANETYDELIKRLLKK